jgi:hypothetical protein
LPRKKPPPDYLQLDQYQTTDDSSLYMEPDGYSPESEWEMSTPVRTRRVRREIRLPIPTLIALALSVLVLVGLAFWLIFSAKLGDSLQDTPEAVARRFMAGWQENQQGKMEAALHKSMREGLMGVIVSGTLSVVHYSCLEADAPGYDTTPTGDNSARVRVTTLLKCAPGTDLPWLDIRAGIEVSKPFALDLETVKDGNLWYITGITPDFDP